MVFLTERNLAPGGGALSSSFWESSSTKLAFFTRTSSLRLLREVLESVVANRCTRHIVLTCELQ